jgi:hypothetical protein
VDEFLEDHAVIVMSDHSQVEITARVNLARALEPWRVLGPSDVAPSEAELAVCPAGRSAQVYVLDDDGRDARVQRVASDLRTVEGVDLVIHLREGEAVVTSARGELRFGPGDEFEDDRGKRWSVEGEEAVLDLELRDGRVIESAYPDPFGRLWSALCCPNGGDVLASADPGYEFVDWGGADHVGGGSHGSLHRDDSLGVLLTCGVDHPAREHWSLADVTPLVLRHFALSS